MLRPRPRRGIGRLGWRLGWPLTLALLTRGAQAATFVPGTPPDPATGEVAVPVPPEAQASEPLRGSGFQWRLGPWRRSGSLALDLRWTRQEDGSRGSQGLVVSEFEWTNYLWQPWFVQMRLGLGLLAARDVAQSGNGQGAQGGNTGLTARGGLSLFPSSRFPFELRADLSDSRSSGDNLGSAQRSQRWSLSQSYRPEMGQSGLQLNLDQSRLYTASSSDVLTSFNATGQHQSGDHQMDLSASWSLNHLSDSGETSQARSVSARHGYHPSTALQVDTLANWNVQRLSGPALAARGAETDLRQLSSVFSWRPASGQPLYDPERPLVLAASARWVEARSQGSDDQRVQSVNASLGAGLELLRTVRLTASLAASRTQDQTTAAVEAWQANAAATWTPTGVALGSWRYAPSLSSGLGLSQVSGTPRVRQLGLQGTHAVSRGWELGESQALALNFSQAVGWTDSNRAERPSQTLAHNLGLFWQGQSGEDHQRYAGLSVSDARSRTQGSDHFQMANLQLSQRVQASRQLGWTVNLTLQTTRSRTQEPDPATGRLVANDTGWQAFLNGGATLEQQRLFGIPRLRHTLNLSLSSAQIERRSAGDIDAPRERISRSLESRLDYSIGRLELRVLSRLAKVDARQVMQIQARLMRRF